MNDLLLRRKKSKFMPFKRFKSIALILVATTALVAGISSKALASNWTTINIQHQYVTENQYGDVIEDSFDEESEVISLNLANDWAYGDNYIFIDLINPIKQGDKTSASHYVEWHPRLSLNKIFNKPKSDGFIKEILLAGQLEVGEDFRTYQYGLGFNLNTPGFAWMQLNFYIRDRKDDFDTDGIDSGTGWQITPKWHAPFTIGNVDFAFGGFIDWRGKEGKRVSDVMFKPQLMMDFGKLTGVTEAKTLYAGIKYVYWKNQFGIKGNDVNYPMWTLQATW